MTDYNARKNEQRMEWLRRNAQVVNVRAEQDHSSDVWQKAVRNPDVDVKRAKGQGHLAVGSFTGKTPTDFDGVECQFYHLFMARFGGEFEDATFVASCTCPAFRHDETRPCKHICRAVQFDELETSVIVKSGSLVRDVREQTEDGARSTGKTTVLDDDSEAERGETESQTTADDGTAPQPAVATDGASPPAPQPEDDAFASPLPEVSEKFVMEIGGDQYIRKAGYARLLRQQGWRVLSTEIVGAHETDWTRAKYRAVILDDDGETLAQSVGTAGPPDKEELADVEMYLDELAETRAWTRAASIATGEGMTALAEVHPGQSDVGADR